MWKFHRKFRNVDVLFYSVTLELKLSLLKHFQQVQKPEKILPHLCLFKCSIKLISISLWQYFHFY